MNDGGIRATLVLAFGLAAVCVGAAGVGAATLRVPGDAGTIGEAVGMALSGDTIELAGGGVYRELLDLRRGPAGLTIRAAAGTTATLRGDQALFATAGTDLPGKLLIAGKDIAFERIRFEIDANGLQPVAGGHPYQLAMVTRGKATFTDCGFEMYGRPTDARALADEMVMVEGNADAEFNRCRWGRRWLMMALPEGAAYLAVRTRGSVRCDGCDFNTIVEEEWLGDVRAYEFWNKWPDPPETLGMCPTAVRITGGGEVSFNACLFGGKLKNAAASYVQVYDHGKPVRFEDCVFEPGYRRGLMLWGAKGETVSLNRCIVRAAQMAHGRFFFAQPGPPMQFLSMRNTVYHFNSAMENDMDCTQFRVATLEHCTVVDSAGTSGWDIGRVMDVDSTTEQLVAVRNCVIAMPRMKMIGAVHHMETPGKPIVHAEGNVVLGRRALIESLPEGSFVEGDPKLAIDMVHLLPGSAARGAATAIGVADDIDGDARPASGRVDAGADQADTALDLPPWLVEALPVVENPVTTASAGLLVKLEMTIRQLRREWDAEMEMGERFLEENPESPLASEIVGAMIEGNYRRILYTEKNPMRAAATGGKLAHWKDEDERLMRLYLRLTETTPAIRLEDPDWDPESLPVTRARFRHRLGEMDAMLAEIARVEASRPEMPWEHKARLLLYKAIGVGSREPRDNEGGLAICESILLDHGDRLGEFGDVWVITVANWGTQFAMNIGELERGRRLYKLIEEYPTDHTEKVGYLMRYGEFASDPDRFIH